jgi:hypothetical protein
VTARATTTIPKPRDLERARAVFREHEPRDVFYRAARELVEGALRGDGELEVSEALAVLLQTWNRAYYQYRPFDEQHLADIDRLCDDHRADVDLCRTMTVDDVSSDDEAFVRDIFGDFESVLGPVGAAKALHLLAPAFFPLWDRAIAAATGLPLEKVGSNSDLYFRFMRLAQLQCRELRAAGVACEDLLKRIDEYNYCRYTKGWL